MKKNIHMKGKNTLVEYIAACTPIILQQMLICSFNVQLCNISHLENKNQWVSLFPSVRSRQSNINTVGARKVGHVGRQGRVGGQNFNGQIPAERVHIDVFCAGPHGDLRLVLQHRGWLQRLSGSNEFKVQTPLQDHCRGGGGGAFRRSNDTRFAERHVLAFRWLTYVCAKAWCDIEGNWKREMTGGSVEARFQVSSVSRHAHRLPWAPLVLLLDLLLALQADRILQSKNQHFFFVQQCETKTEHSNG